MPKMKPHELKNFQGLAVARNAGPSRQQENSERIDAARADKAVIGKRGKDAGELGKPWDQYFRRGGAR